ncbi:MAG: glycoside hydrolase family 65 protein [Thermanaeromonas sp.]|uniref:glycoside hydrolase family 65 protein n=1 Tax=Thermanaeromonas sp. TaxID=2003697 RepID=UPI00243C6BE5|nr:glycosyl hydrolase family 65 protein [Thermanaeromonas sp.]MCG0278296.1 glycoside hydrolase family 65 protein [Thermanaeromonas sp.]
MKIYPIEEWQIRETEFDIETNYRDETIFATGNGYIGMRGNLEEGYSGPPGTTFNATYLNGFYEEYDIEYPEDGYGFARKGQAMLNVAEAKTVKLDIDGEEFDLLKGKIHFYERVLDLNKGILRRKVVWESASGKKVEVEIKRIVSFPRPRLAALAITVKPLNFEGELKFTSRIDGQVSNLTRSKDMRVGAGLKGRSLITVENKVEGTLAWIRQKTLRSGLSLVCAVEHSLVPANKAKVLGYAGKDTVEVRFELRASRGASYTLFKYISYFTSRDYEENSLVDLALEEVRRAKKDGFQILEKEQEEFLAGFWEDADIKIEGDPAAQQGIRFCLFSLLQSTGRDGKTNIAAKGLTGEGYGGHYFWDSDIYVLPFFLFTWPEVAKALLLHRYSLLDAARSRARELRHKGALYPWRTISGLECSAYFPAGTAQYHINADIIYALKRYVEVTGDVEFLWNYGAEMVFETARFWVDLGAYIPGRGNKFCFHCVTGPDEYKALVDNNAYTNYMAKMNLEYAVEVAEKMKRERPADYARVAGKIKLAEKEIKEWRRAAAHVYLPYSRKLKIIPQDDSFLFKKRLPADQIPREHFPLLLHWHYLNIYRYQICKQPDVLLLLFLLREKFTLEDVKRNYDYYEPITTHDSSLSPPIFSILAWEIGYEEKAYKYFLHAARMDLDDYHGNTKDGIHAASMGGAWGAAVYGFGGMRVYPEGLHFYPSIPNQWKRLSFSIKYRGRKIKVTVEKNRAHYTLVQGEALKICHFGKEVLLNPGATVSRRIPSRRRAKTFLCKGA